MRDIRMRRAAEAYTKPALNTDPVDQAHLGAVSRCRMWDGLPTDPKWQTAAARTIWGSGGRLLGLACEATWEVRTEWRQELSGRSPNYQPVDGALYYAETGTKVTCASPGAFCTQARDAALTTTTRIELFTPTVATPDEYRQLVGAALASDARSAAVIFSAAEMVLMTAHLLELRRIALVGQQLPDALGLAVMVDFDMPEVTLRNALPPKLSGVASVPPADFAYLQGLTGAKGPLTNICVFSMSAGYNLFVYGGTLGGLWAELECMFLCDYSIGNTATVQAALTRCYTDLFSHFHGDTALEAHVRTAGTIMDCNYTALKAKVRLEDACVVESKPIMCIWGDLDLLARYRALDGLFGHAMFDSRADGDGYAMAGWGVG